MRVGFVSCVLMCLICTNTTAQDCGCGPTYCLDDTAFAKEMAKKMKVLQTNGVPARLIALYSQLGHCTASLTTSPDSPNIYQRKSDGSVVIDTWTEENERIGAADLKKGLLNSCLVIISRHAFSCCGQANYSKRTDYDASLDLNLSATAVCQ